jgi:hypothetical protein
MCKQIVREALESLRAIGLRKYGFSIDFESKRLLRKNDIIEIEQRAWRILVNVNNTEERNCLFHEDLIMKLNNLIKTQKDEKNTHIEEITERMDHHSDENTRGEDLGICDEAFWSEYELDLKVQKVKSAPPEEINWIFRVAMETSWSDDGGQMIQDKNQAKRRMRIIFWNRNRWRCLINNEFNSPSLFIESKRNGCSW